MKNITAKLLSTMMIMVLLTSTILSGCSQASKAEESLLQAQTYLEEENYAQALLLYEEILSKDAANTEACLGSVKAYIKQSQFDKAYAALQQGVSAGISLDGLSKADFGTNDTDKVYISLLLDRVGDMQNVTDLLAIFNEIVKVDGSFIFSAEQLNLLADNAVKNEECILDVIKICNKTMLEHPEIEMDAEIASDLLLKATELVTREDEDFMVIDNWIRANYYHQDALICFLEKKMGFKFPEPEVKDFSDKAKEILEENDGAYLVRHYEFTREGEFRKPYLEDGDYSIYNKDGVVIYNSNTDIDVPNQEVLQDAYFEYDSQGRLIKWSGTYWAGRSDGGRLDIYTRFEYDEEGKLVKKYAYDAVEKREKIYDRYSYDSQGRLISVESEYHKTTFTYDDVNKVIHEKYVDDIWGETYESEVSWAHIDGPVAFRILCYAGTGIYLYSNVDIEPVALGELSDGTKYYTEDGNIHCYDINSYVFREWDNKNSKIGGISTDAIIEQYKDANEDSINSHLAGKQYYTQTEDGIEEVVFDEYGLCDYYRMSGYYSSGTMLKNDVVVDRPKEYHIAYELYLKKYNEDGSIFVCPVIIQPEYDYYIIPESRSESTWSFTGYFYEEYYR